MRGLKKEDSHSQSQMDELKFVGGDQELTTPTLFREHPIRGEGHAEIFLENQRGLFHHQKTHFRVPVKRELISGPRQEASYTAITLNQESNSKRREKNHSLFH